MAASGAHLLIDVVEWLGKRKLGVPTALRAACPNGPRPVRASGAAVAIEHTAEFRWAITLLPGLKERERRALARHVQRSHDGMDQGNAPMQSSTSTACSDGEDDAEDGSSLPGVRGGSWPSEVEYSNDYRWGADVPAALRLKYQPAGARARPARPSPRVFAEVITEPTHPAHGQCGLFAAVPLAHGAWVLDYVGAVALGENEDRSSDYVCDFGEASELALDANRVGNEGRFVNDYRNTGLRANVEFRLRRDARGELRQGIFVCAKEGVGAGEELLISYGKSYWRSRVGNLEDFIVRRPGEAKPRGPHDARA